MTIINNVIGNKSSVNRQVMVMEQFLVQTD